MISAHRRVRLNGKAYAVLVLCAAIAIWLGFPNPRPRPLKPHSSLPLFGRSFEAGEHLRNQSHTQFLEDQPFNARIAHPLQTKAKADYNNYVAKGCRLWKLLQRKGDNDYPRSGFSEIADLEKWGWRETQPIENLDARLEKVLKGIKEPLASKHLGITSAEGAKNIEWTHVKGVTIDGTTYGATQAKYMNVYWPQDGAIVSYNNYSPQFYKSFGHGGETPIPELNHWSDMAFLTWVRETNDGQRRALRWIVRLNVVNEDTQNIVPEALKKVGVKSGLAPAWPGYTFRPEENDLKPFQAVLATPNVRGIPWLLLQHEYHLDRKTIKSITVWDKSGMANQDAGVQLSIMIEIGDFEEEPGR